MNGNDFFAAFEGLIRKVVREEMQSALHPSTDWRDQREDRVLTPRMHCAAARRRMAEGKADAKKLGDRYLLTTDAIAEELERIGRPKALAKADTSRAPLSPEDEALDRISRRLRRVL